MDIIVVKLAIWSILLLILKLNATTDINSLLTSYCSTPSECQINEYDGEADSTNEADAPETKSLQCLACSCDSFCSYKKNCCPTKRMGVKGMLSKSDAGFEMSVDSERGNAPKSADSDMIGMSEPILNFSCIIPRSNVEQTDGPTASVAEGLGLYMVTSCKQGFRDQRCTESTVDVLEQNLPQTSLNTSITYRNTFCGECNNDTELVSWKPYITCSDSYLLKADQLLFPISVEKLYQLAISSEDGECGIEFRPPDNFDQSRDMCYKNELVQTCTSNNILLLSACKSFSMPFFHKESNVTIAYANVFCYLCQNNSQLSANHFDEILKFPTMANALVGELNIDNENARDIEEFTFLAREIAERYDSHCEPGHVFDPFEVRLVPGLVLILHMWMGHYTFHSMEQIRRVFGNN